MIILEGESDDVPVGVFIGMIPRRSVLHRSGAGHVYFLHDLGLANVPGSVEAVHQLKPKEKEAEISAARSLCAVELHLSELVTGQTVYIIGFHTVGERQFPPSHLPLSIVFRSRNRCLRSDK